MLSPLDFHWDCLLFSLLHGLGNSSHSKIVHITKSAEPLSEHDLFSLSLLAHLPPPQGSLSPPNLLVQRPLLLPLQQLSFLYFLSNQLGLQNKLPSSFFFLLHSSGKTQSQMRQKNFTYMYFLSAWEELHTRAHWSHSALGPSSSMGPQSCLVVLYVSLLGLTPSVSR